MLDMTWKQHAQEHSLFSEFFTGPGVSSKKARTPVLAKTEILCFRPFFFPRRCWSGKSGLEWWNVAVRFEHLCQATNNTSTP